MKVVVLAGGSGTRLWPMSRQNYPKQFLRLKDNQSLLQHTIERVLKLVKPSDVIIMTNESYKFHVLNELKAAGVEAEHLILEPAVKNTAPAIALALSYLRHRLGCKDDEPILICPSDHLIAPIEAFKECVLKATELAFQRYIVTFGVYPSRPETGYGYIKAGNKLECGGYKVEQFVEKPDLETAQQYLAQGSYFWNAGLFLFTLKTMWNNFKKHAPQIYQFLEKDFDEFVSHFKELPTISIDYAVMEQSEDAAVYPLNLSWSDVGSWDSVYEVLEKDSNGNVTKGQVLSLDTKDCLLMSSKRLLTAIGLKDLVVVETDDALLVARRGDSQRVKEVVEILKKQGQKEAIEHTTTYRPWGSYTVLEVGPRYKIKKLVVKQGERLSLQMHHHRSEHWVVIRGTAKVTVGDKEVYLHENESIYVPKSTKHRLENPGKIPLEIIEIQVGEYVEEDDIIRFGDVYGRS